MLNKYLLLLSIMAGFWHKFHNFAVRFNSNFNEISIITHAYTQYKNIFQLIL